MDENEIVLPFNISNVKPMQENTFNTKLKKCIIAIASRTIDILGGLVGCMCVIPITLAVIVNNIKDKDFGPIFFSQERIGKNGQIFKMYKFRTMVKNADQKLDELLEKV